MKKATLTVLAACAVAGTSFAGTQTVSSKEYKQVAAEAAPCFKNQELTLDVFYSFNDGRKGGGNNHYFNDASGGGVGVDYFFARYVGVGVEGNWDGGGPDNVVLHQAVGNLILRYPIEGRLCFAPYIFGGGGMVFDGKKTSVVDAGAGVELRLTQHIGLFGDWRYNFTGQNRNDSQTSRAGIRFAF